MPGVFWNVVIQYGLLTLRGSSGNPDPGTESADLLRKSLLLSLGAAQISSADSCEQDKRLKFELLIVYMYSKKLLTENTGWYYNSRN